MAGPGAALPLPLSNRPVDQVQSLDAGKVLGVVANQRKAASNGLPRDQCICQADVFLPQITAHLRRCDGGGAVEGREREAVVDCIEVCAPLVAQRTQAKHQFMPSDGRYVAAMRAVQIDF